MSGSSLLSIDWNPVAPMHSFWSIMHHPDLFYPDKTVERYLSKNQKRPQPSVQAYKSIEIYTFFPPLYTNVSGTNRWIIQSSGQSLWDSDDMLETPVSRLRTNIRLRCMITWLRLRCNDYTHVIIIFSSKC